MRPRISIKGSVCPSVCPSVNNTEKPPKTTISACETHRITRPGLFLNRLQDEIKTRRKCRQMPIFIFNLPIFYEYRLMALRILSVQKYTPLPICPSVRLAIIYRRVIFSARQGHRNRFWRERKRRARKEEENISGFFEEKTIN